MNTFYIVIALSPSVKDVPWHDDGIRLNLVEFSISFPYFPPHRAKHFRFTWTVTPTLWHAFVELLVYFLLIYHNVTPKRETWWNNMPCYICFSSQDWCGIITHRCRVTVQRQTGGLKWICCWCSLELARDKGNNWGETGNMWKGKLTLWNSIF